MYGDKTGNISDKKHEAKQSLNAGTQRTLVPNLAYRAAFLITLTVPNLVFSGPSWFDTLHIMKWFVTMTPIGILAIWAGYSLFRYGAGRINFAIDPFAMAWLAFILLISSQPIFIRLTSKSTFVKEWFFFATLFAVYLLAYNLPMKSGFFRAILWGCGLNGAINVLFAELVMRGKTGLPFFIMDVPGNYIGNTAQQEMLGLWLAMAIFNCLFLHIHYAGEWKTGKRAKILLPLNLFFMSVNAWGLWNSTTRGAILAFVVGFIVIYFSFRQSKFLSAVKHLNWGVFFLLALILAASLFGNASRISSLIVKTLDMVQNPGTFGGRIAIWRVSKEVFLEYPVTGVGLGHYKWHFLEGQRVLFEKNPELPKDPNYRWQFTYWAHSEYLQWLCETGLMGSIPMLLLCAWWLYKFLQALISRKQMTPEAIWGAGMLFMLFFDALFSRPFHRIENAVWMSFAFAQVNRFLLPEAVKFAERENETVYKAFGVFMASVATCGLLFLGGGMIGDKLMLKAVYPSSDEAKRSYLNRAGDHLMSMDDALEQMANLDISMGDWDDEAYVKGVRELYVAYKTRPNSERLFKLFECARELNNAELMKELIPFLPPGSVRLE